ncbi:MAG: hypothetical protein HYR66_06625 [Sphingobacteriales bacterium]|nr:hypothetical protein [Sphingobacteriales bacterium]MBI3717399.1 hypothetical protein [Sphingobacteriales bacterium]
MKKIFGLFLLMIIGVAVNAQHVISLNNKKQLTINHEEDNSSKELVIKLKAGYPAKALLTIKDMKQAKAWIRTYTVTDEKDNVITELSKSTKANTQQILIQTLLKKLEAGKKYFIYTMAKPSDPKIAASIRVRRYLLCSVTVQ